MEVAALYEQITRWAEAGQPFFFAVDYAQKQGLLLASQDPNPLGVLYSIGGKSNHSALTPINTLSALKMEAFPESYETYLQRFRIVQEGLRHGNSFLANLTVRTPLSLSLSLEDVYRCTQALYKVLLPGRFVCFSPERFVRISKEGIISSNPMKGTIDATLPRAEELILSNPKEQAEHATIVDLIRNDLSMVAQGVYVKRYRYIDRVETQTGALLQVSSEICGCLPHDWRSHLGEILHRLLPAGSISGAPKRATVELIDRAEQLSGMPPHERGFYTGICGYFDGEELDTGVMIRFIEELSDGSLCFHSGGGITIHSDSRSEYQEVMDKIYLPLV
ncbi:MAG: aminodeoxychorismate synthase component I [Porphyromonas sp.]|nr:aminodeoxychorismate synthase component I [Porphyromonas sp.]